MRTTGRTRLLVLLGDRVAHSVSPAMHSAAFQAMGLDAAYVGLPCRGEDVAPLMRAITRGGGGGNVTVPHKQVAFEALDRRLESNLPACNTFWGEEDGKLAGTNTDVEGIRCALHELDVTAGDWWILGTGGSARSVIEVARQAGARIAVSSRDPARAERLLSDAAALGVQEAPQDTCRLVVNTTPLGLRKDDPLPLDPERMPAGAAALDLVYGPGGTAWTRALAARSVPASDGRTVLVAQGAAAFRHWFPAHDPPVELMRAVVNRVLE